MLEEIKQKLIKHPEYRERRKKAEFLAKWLRSKYPSILGSIERVSTIESMVDEVISAERYWREVLQDNPDLRGSDYQTRDKVTQDYQIGLGYEPGYVDDIKRLKNI